MLSNDNRQYILSVCLKLIYEISSRDYQIKTWILGDNPNGCDYDEHICLFSDYMEMILNHTEEYELTKLQLDQLKKLRRAFEKFDSGPNAYWPPDFIDTSEWKKVMNQAKNVLKAFNYQHKPFVPVADAEKPSASGDS